MESVEINPEIEKAAEESVKASEGVVNAFEKINKEGTISAENEKILNDALKKQFQADMDFAEEEFKSENERDMTGKEITDLYNNFKDLYKVENGKVSDAVRNISLNNPELAKLIDDMIRENAKTALNSPVFANMETELANFDFDLTDDNFQNKIKILLDNRIYRQKINNIVNKLSKPLRSAKFWGFIGIGTVIGILIPILIAIKNGTLSPTGGAINYSKALSGCFMIYGDGQNPQIIKLDGCSDWYSSDPKNSLLCRCGSAKSLADVKCAKDDMGLPYCIGQSGDTSGGSKCVNPLLESYKMDVCQGIIGEKGPYVYYTTHIEQALGMMPKIIKIITSPTSNTSNTTNSTIGTVGKILLTIVIIIAVLMFGLTIYNTFFQNKIGKSLKR